MNHAVREFAEKVGFTIGKKFVIGTEVRLATASETTINPICVYRTNHVSI